MQTKGQVLQQYFGYDRFREGQEPLIDSILAGQDALGIMPTGAGKSLCFQIPAILTQGVALVISPLISLMRDQVTALTQAGIPAAFINSSLNERQISLALDRARMGAYKLIYIAPERLLCSDFLYFAKRARIGMLTVDEAHCISQWGQDFRPSYAKIPDFIAQLPRRPVLCAFTATATPNVKDDILHLLGLQNPTVLVTGFDRKNLYFEVQRPKDKFAALLHFLQDKKDRCGIVYCSTRNAVEEVCQRLQQNGYGAARYHAGLGDTERVGSQEDFLYDRVQIMVATNAFGMGIDKSNVSFVVHYNMPKDVESYYQEAGRAGRDGSPAHCLLLFSKQDVRTNTWLIENAKEELVADPQMQEALKERERARLRNMTSYCTISDCLRSYILRYFGETPQSNCGNCGNCLGNYQVIDVTVDAQKILSCVARAGERYDVNMIIDVLRGSKNQKLLLLGLDRLTTYGISDKPVAYLRDVANHLLHCDFLRKTDAEFPVLQLGERAQEVLRAQTRVQMKQAKQLIRQDAYEIDRSARCAAATMDQELFAVLKTLSRALASEQNVPAYVIFSDSSLADMCAKAPTTEEQFLQVSGVGEIKLERYGTQFLDAIASYLESADENNEDTVDTADREVADEIQGIQAVKNT